MKRAYLGDSYDAVKRLWQQALAEWIPLYAEPLFIPKDLRAEFTCLTAIPMLHAEVSRPFSILNDPDTGIRLPGQGNQAESRKHIALRTIHGQLKPNAASLVVTFDQSDYRQSGLKLAEQRETKLRCLAEAGVSALYYVSHAPFMFACVDANLREQLRQRLLTVGIPNSRLETCD